MNFIQLFKSIFGLNLFSKVEILKMEEILLRAKNAILALKSDKDGLLSENADLKQKLASALADDAADHQAIADAQAAAEVAQAAARDAAAHTAELQQRLDAQVAQEEELKNLLDSLEQVPAA